MNQTTGKTSTYRTFEQVGVEGLGTGCQSRALQLFQRFQTLHYIFAVYTVKRLCWLINKYQYTRNAQLDISLHTPNLLFLTFKTPMSHLHKSTSVEIATYQALSKKPFTSLAQIRYDLILTDLFIWYISNNLNYFSSEGQTSLNLSDANSRGSRV